MRHVIACGLVLALVGCGDDDGADPMDAGGGGEASGSSTMDAGGGEEDAGGGGEDAGGGEEDAGGGEEDAGGGGGCPDLMPTGDVPELIISQINFATREVEIFNPGDTDVSLGDASSSNEHQWCERPFYDAVVETGADVVPAGGYAVFTLPTRYLSDSTNGELALYAAGPPYGIVDGVVPPILDFVCWGSGASSTRQDVAETAGIWSGDCVASPTSDAIVRNPSTDGTSADSYDSTASYEATVCD